MPVEQYQSGAHSGVSYTIEYGAGWYIIQQDGKVLKQVSSAAAMGLAEQDATLQLTRATAIADIDTQHGIDS